jgi:hypothetical protein
MNKSPITNVENIVFNITMPNGMIVTSPEQFYDYEIEENNDNDNTKSIAP